MIDMKGSICMKKKISAIVTAAVIALSATACGKSETKDEKVVRIAYLPITHSLAVLEEADELEAKEGVKVELVKYGSWNELTDALNSNRVDGASVLMELAMKSKQEGIGIKAVALGHHDGNVIVVKNDIESAEDLKGKNIAIPHRQSSHNILINDALAKAGLTVDDVNITELAPTEMPSALASGQIDAYCVAEPFGAMGVSIGAGKVLYRSDELWEDSICCGLVLTDKFINDRPEDAKNFVDSYKAAGAELTKEKAKETAKKYLSQSDEVLDMSLEWISYDDLEITEEAYDALVEKVKSYGLSEEPPAYSDFVKNDL
jgi:ABC-type nitrate/sulfonate/bicarbonate transport systems, periplasmic components